MQRILVTGGNGLLACQLRKMAPGHGQFFFLGHAEFDLLDAGLMARRLAELQPRVVINTAAYNLVDRCETERDLDADGLLAGVRHALTVAHHAAMPPAEVAFSYLGMPPDPTLGPLQVTDGPALGVLAYRRGDEMRMDWWYDMRRLDRCTVEELAAQFRLGLIGLTSEASRVEGAA